MYVYACIHTCACVFTSAKDLQGRFVVVENYKEKKPRRVPCAWNLSLWEIEAGEAEFKVSPGHKANPDSLSLNSKTLAQKQTSSSKTRLQANKH